MKDKLNSFLGSRPLLRNGAMLLSGNVLALIIPFALAPFITRVYSPADFASYELYVKLLTLVTVVASLRYELAVILPSRESEAQSITRICFRLLLFISTATLVSIVFRESIGDYFENDNLSPLIWYIPIGVLITGIFSVLTQVAMRLGRFRLMSLNKVIGAGTNHTSKLALGWFMPGPLGLVLGHLIGTLIPTVSLAVDKKIRPWLGLGKADESKSLWKLGKQYREFPLYNGTHAFYDEFIKTLLFLIISVAYGEIALGLFAFALRYLRIPLLVLGTSLSQVLTPELAQRKNNGKDGREVIRQTILTFAAIGILPFGMLMIYGEPVFSIIFGDEWGKAGSYAAIMAPWLYFNFLSSPLSTVPTVYGRQGAFFGINVVGSILTLIAVYVLYRNQTEFETVLIAMAVINSVLHVLLLYWFWKIAAARIPLK